MKIRYFKPLLAAGSLAAALGTGLAQAEPSTDPAAQDQSAPSQQSAPQAAQAPAADVKVTDEKLEQFVDAATDVQDVQTTYTERMQQAADQQEAQTLRQEAQDKMVSAVEESGLSVQEYNLIAQRLQTDPALAQRMKDLQGDG